MKKLFSILFTSAILISCQTLDNTAKIEQWKLEILSMEKEFNDMAQSDGLVRAFEYYAAENGVIKRGKNVVMGKAAIAEWYEKDVRSNETLTWKPTFVDVSSSGDLAYTYGDYVFTSYDTLGNKKENKGIFHTVWKKQADGSWRFVYD